MSEVANNNIAEVSDINCSTQVNNISSNHTHTEYNPSLGDVIMAINRQSEVQIGYIKKQLFYQRLTAISIIILTLIVGISIIIIVPKVIVTLEYVNTTMEIVSVTVEDVSESIEGIVKVFDNVDSLLTESRATLVETLEDINGINFKELNNAIEDLQSIVEPLASFFGKFKN